MIRTSLLKKIFYFAPRLVLVSLFMILVIITLLGNFDIFEPYLYPLHLAQGKIASFGSTITIGPYPNARELNRLKRDRRIEIDISLLNSELPQEKALNAQLEKTTRKLGIEVKYFPLSYIDFDGVQNKKTIADVANYIAQNRSKRIYIHCYLGRHRVAAVRNELIRLGLITDNMPTRGNPNIHTIWGHLTTSPTR